MIRCPTYSIRYVWPKLPAPREVNRISTMPRMYPSMARSWLPNTSSTMSRTRNGMAAVVALYHSMHRTAPQKCGHT